MSKAIENLMNAQRHAMSIHSKVGRFPFLAETLRQAGVSKNIWSLPSCQSLYLTRHGPVVQQNTPLVNGAADVAKFDKDALVQALRIDQAGQSTFQEFLQAAWNAGVISYTADFEGRKVTYYGASAESYAEDYPAVEIKQ